MFCFSWLNSKEWSKTSTGYKCGGPNAEEFRFFPLPCPAVINTSQHAFGGVAQFQDGERIRYVTCDRVSRFCYGLRQSCDCRLSLKRG